MRMGKLNCGIELLLDIRRAAFWSALLVVLALPAIAKTPGETHCYRKVCHRVKTIPETRALIGHMFSVVASHYDAPSKDRFNRGVFTSSGTRFDAEDKTAAASSNLPDGTEILVWNPSTGYAAHIRITDFGPFHTNRTLDLTRSAAATLGFANEGVSVLKVTVIAAPPPDEPTYKLDRVYHKVGGFLGVYRKDELEPLASLLTTQARQRRQNEASRLLALRTGPGGVDYVKPTRPRNPATKASAAFTRPSPALVTLAAFESRSQVNGFDAEFVRRVAVTFPSAPHLAVLPAFPHTVAPGNKLERAPVPAGRYVTAKETKPEIPKYNPNIVPASSNITTASISVATDKTSINTTRTRTRVAELSTNTKPDFGVSAGYTSRKTAYAPGSNGLAFLMAILLLTSSAFCAAYMSVNRAATPARAIGSKPPRSHDGRRIELADVQIVVDQERATTTNPGKHAPPRHDSAPHISPAKKTPANGSKKPDQGDATVVRPGSTISGNLTTSGCVIVEGHIEGDCICDFLTIGRGGVVSGRVAAKNATIAGRVEGTVDVADLHALTTAHVIGDVRYSNLVLETGAQLEARCKRVDTLANRLAPV